jgi:cobalt/nickel transport system ATP-binding protein
MALLQALPQTRIVATHDLDLALGVCNRVLVMHEGRIEADGAPAAVFRDAALLRRCHLEPPLAWQRRSGA